MKSIATRGRSIFRQVIFPYSLEELKRKMIFVHIPKAAGTAVRVALGEPETGRKHLPWWVYQQASPKKFRNFYKFAFVRHPLDRAVSGYWYLKAGGNKMEDLSVAEHLEKYSSFGEFVDGELVNGNMIYHPIFRPQSWYLCDWKGQVQVDYVGRVESISADFQKVACRLNLKNYGGLKIINQSSKKEWEKVENNVSKTIYEIYKDDFDFFDYE